MFFAKKVELYNILVLFFRLDFHTESKKYIIICRDLHRTWSFPWSNLCNASAKLWYFLNLIGSLPFSNNDVSVKSSLFRIKSWYLNMTQSTLPRLPWNVKWKLVQWFRSCENMLQLLNCTNLIGIYFKILGGKRAILWSNIVKKIWMTAKHIKIHQGMSRKSFKTCPSYVGVKVIKD